MLDGKQHQRDCLYLEIWKFADSWDRWVCSCTLCGNCGNLLKKNVENRETPFTCINERLCSSREPSWIFRNFMEFHGISNASQCPFRTKVQCLQDARMLGGSCPLCESSRSAPAPLFYNPKIKQWDEKYRSDLGKAASSSGHATSGTRFCERYTVFFHTLTHSCLWENPEQWTTIRWQSEELIEAAWFVTAGVSLMASWR